VILVGIACTSLQRVDAVKKEESDDGEESDEHFVDVHGVESDGEERNVKREDGGDVKPGKAIVRKGNDRQSHAAASNKRGWVHRDHLGTGNSPFLISPLLLCIAVFRAPGSRYDSDARNPAFAGAEFTVLTELLQLARHFHPTVAVYAQNLIEARIVVRPDVDHPCRARDYGTTAIR
jgi:ribosome biogenesis protein MAK21